MSLYSARNFLCYKRDTSWSTKWLGNNLKQFMSCYSCERDCQGKLHDKGTSGFMRVGFLMILAWSFVYKIFACVGENFLWSWSPEWLYPHPVDGVTLLLFSSFSLLTSAAYRERKQEIRVKLQCKTFLVIAANCLGKMNWLPGTETDKSPRSVLMLNHLESEKKQKEKVFQSKLKLRVIKLRIRAKDTLPDCTF